MSRLRARTWTALERRVMRLWRLSDGFTGLNDTVVRFYSMDCGVNDVRAEAEHIMRTKGIDVNTAWRNITHPPLCPPIWEPEDMDELRGIRDGQRLSRRPDAAMRASVGEARLERRFRCCYVPSASNPNIYVRRSA